MNTFRVLKISNNLKDYPECKDDTLEFPDLVKEVGDEMDIFIYCLETNRHWRASDFFYSVGDLKSFSSHQNIK